MAFSHNPAIFEPNFHIFPFFASVETIDALISGEVIHALAINLPCGVGALQAGVLSYG